MPRSTARNYLGSDFQHSRVQQVRRGPEQKIGVSEGDRETFCMSRTRLMYLRWMRRWREMRQMRFFFNVEFLEPGSKREVRRQATTGRASLGRPQAQLRWENG